jgi:hypothetical protein
MKKKILLNVLILVMFAFAVAACSSGGGTTVTINPVTISTTSLPDGVQRVAYTASLAATGGTIPYTWTIASGSLSGGLAIDPNTGVISGTPSTGETSTFTVRVTDSAQPATTATQSLSITITIPLTNRIQAAQATVASNSNCTTIGDFYWEIGDTSGSLVSGAVGTTYSSSTAMDIASASKLIFGAYVVESFKTDLSKADAQAMRMGSGYVSLEYAICLGKANVDDCFQAKHLLTQVHNSDYTDADKGKFYYNGGHFQWYADVGLKLGSLDNAGLAAEMKNQLGTELNIAYGSPQLAGGAYMSADDYAQFLRKIISGGLAIKDHLGEDPVCTLPGTSCPTAVYSPASPYNWHYSWGHWIEDDSSIGDDGAFSSPGAFGFYPWIDSSKQYYGILARRSDTSGAYKESAMCGRLIRAAFLTGVAQ